jgi:hypothetical protein
MVRGPFPSKAAAALRVYEDRLARAQRDYDEAAKALAEARIVLDVAEQAHEAARHVFQASEADRASALGFDRVAPSTLAWLGALADYDTFGVAEARDAAASVGVTLSDDAIRQHMTKLTAREVFIRRGHGAYRFSDEARSHLAANRRAADARAVLGTGSAEPATASGSLNESDAAGVEREGIHPGADTSSDSQSVSGASRAGSSGGEFDYRDDDPPF